MPITTTPSGGPQGEYSTLTPLYSTTLSSAASSITFSNIPLDYTDLVIHVNAAVTASDNELFLQLGGTSLDTGSNYGTTFLFSGGSSALTTRQSNNTYCNLGRLAVNSSQPTGMSVINLMNYSNSNIYKTIIDICGSASTYIYQNVSTWRSYASISTIKLYPSVSTFIAGSTFTLYGVRAAIPAPKARGGDVSTDGTYWYHTFKSTGVLSVIQAVTAELLVVAGGGGGAVGGGGAGGVKTFSSQSLTTTNYPVVVGAGGIGGFTGTGSRAASSATQGSNSQFASVTPASVGGGYGGTNNINGGDGGSGGGSGFAGSGGSSSGGLGTSGQGNNGGSGYHQPGSYLGVGGAGGAGAAGTNSSGATDGVVGVGTSSYSAWGLATATGQYASGTAYYAGGGAKNSATGGLGGGATGPTYNGGSTLVGNAGTANTGGGGSGTWGDAQGGNGGSGVVIVRYPV